MTDDKIQFTRAEVQSLINTLMQRDPALAFLMQKLASPQPPSESQPAE